MRKTKLHNSILTSKFSLLYNGWHLVFSIVGLTGLLVAIIIAAYGTGELGLSLWLRVTGRTDAIPFAAAFIASPLYQIYPSAFSIWLVNNRRFLGISFALQHLFLHLPAATIWLLVIAPMRRSMIILFSIGILLIAAMLVTSFKGPARWLGYWRWNILHKTGLFYVMFVFLIDFLPGMLHKPISVAYTPFTMLLLCAVVVRMIAFGRKLLRRRVSV